MQTTFAELLRRGSSQNLREANFLIEQAEGPEDLGGLDAVEAVAEKNLEDLATLESGARGSEAD